MSSAARRPDVIVVGAGAVGASAAFHLARAGARVLVLEKEAEPALHQSGRNSRVIHAGYNLKPGSLKAKFCVEGSRRLRAYCRQKGIPMVQGGILVLAGDDGERAVLAELKRRADANGVEARLLPGDAVREVEPHAAGVEALHAPEGASFDPRAFVESLLADARSAGAEVEFATEVRSVREPPGGEVSVQTSRGERRAGALVGCAGLHADRLAGELARDLRVVPFRGYYAEVRPERSRLVRSHVYSAPDLEFPFLGVHLSRWPDGRLFIGPGAMLAFGREAYSLFKVNPRDLAETLLWPGFFKMVSRPGFRGLVAREVKKSLSLRAVWDEARRLVPELRPDDLVRSFSGNRAQLVTRGGELVDDIVVRETARSVHVLNAVSPGLTASLPFGEHLADICLSKLTKS